MRRMIRNGLTLTVILCVACPAGAQTDGSIVGWGDNDSGQLSVPAPNSDFIAVAAGTEHSLGVKSDGTIVAWGRNSEGQCNVPPPNSGFVAVAGGWLHSLGLRANGSIVAWGNNVYGQCIVPAPNSGFVAIAAGVYHSLGLKADGSIRAWGLNSEGQCNVPAPNSGFVALSGGVHHSLGLKADGSIVAWGSNGFGQCNVPAPNSGFVAVAAGYTHSLGLKANGSILAWGSGPVTPPAPNSGFVAIAAGSSHGLGLKADGSIVAWGYNGNGQCNVPAPNSGFVAVVGGCYSAYSLGLKAGSWLPPNSDFDGSGGVDLGDYEFLEPCLTGPSTSSFDGGCGAGDFDFDFDLDLLDFSQFQNVFGSDLADSDGDRIPDVFETDDGQFVSTAETGSDPNEADTDGDFINDGDEVYGTTNGLALNAMGATPVRKDIFVEVDWTDDSNHTHRPSASAIAAVQAAFGAEGIGLHVDYGQGGAFNRGNLIPGSPEFIDFNSGFNTLKGSQFAANRSEYFHYAIFTHRHNSNTNNSSGIAERPGNDFMVTLPSAPEHDGYVSKTFMHELGHNLGLHHGGDECVNNKPNYNSVMNYRYQLEGIDDDCDAEGDAFLGYGNLDYSHGDLEDRSLVQNNLNECEGICGPGDPIDWNDSGGECESQVSFDFTVAEQSCPDVADDYPLNDFDDWGGIVFHGIVSQPDRMEPEIVTCPGAQ